jgi:hypothetical protein
MDQLPSPGTAERNQRRKLHYLPPMWPLLLIVAVIIGIAVLVSR